MLDIYVRYIIYLVIILLIIHYTVKYFDEKHNYWRNLGVPTPKYYYFVGNILDQFLNRRSLGQIVTDAYNDFNGYNYFGFYTSTKPAIIIRNLDIIEKILVTEFNSFHDNDMDVNLDDPLMCRNPFLLNGDEWKQVREQIAPCFTLNNTKLLLPLLQSTSNKLLEYLKQFPGIGINAKDLSTRITTENVANSVFGIEGHSFDAKPQTCSDIKKAVDKTSSINFYTKTQKLLNHDTFDRIKSFILIFFPFLSRLFPNSNKPNEIAEFLCKCIKSPVETRQETSTRKKDFLGFLYDRYGQMSESIFEMKDILSHTSAFFMYGIETSAIVLQHCLYELGKNQLIQDKIRREIVECREQLHKKQELTYEMIHGMQYLDASIKECMRLHPLFYMFIKRVTSPFKLPPLREDNTGSRVALPTGLSVLIPIKGIHLNPKYFNDPHTFRPERFLNEKNHNISRFTFFAFGEGPRKCIGMKFGVLQIKLALITILENYDIHFNNKTIEPIQSDASSFTNMPKDGFWIDLVKLESKIIDT